MEENDHNALRHLKELFRDFETEPPLQNWDSIRARVQGEKPVTSSLRNRYHLVGWFQPASRLYPVVAFVGLFLIVLFVWLAVKPSHQIKGQAFVDQAELTKGTAYLFRVHDKQAPFDSVGFFRKMELDSKGHFLFNDIPAGSYLLRIFVHPDSPYFFHYLHGYYGDQVHWDHARLVSTDHPQNAYDVRIPKMK
ncbi:MAG: hypothetical protein JXA23_05595 [Bacteroidales bacterium]|nr:hypothetical protein [Bacteroidales bacterium]